MRKSAYFGSYVHNKTVLLHTLYCTISNFHSRSAAVKRQRKQTNKTTRCLTTIKTIIAVRITNWRHAVVFAINIHYVIYNATWMLLKRRLRWMLLLLPLRASAVHSSGLCTGRRDYLSSTLCSHGMNAFISPKQSMTVNFTWEDLNRSTEVYFNKST